MEMIVVYNAGKNAAASGMPRVAPDKIEYPKFNQYTGERTTETRTLSDYAKRTWLAGYDRKPHW